MEGRAFQPVGFYPLNSSFEDVRAIVVEAEDEAAVHLDPVAVEYGDAARIVFRNGSSPRGGFGFPRVLQSIVLG
jgi:hypothetical protein